MLTLGIEQVSLGRADFFQRPIIAADIILGGKLTVCVGGVGVDELIALIDAVLCACKRCVALRQALFAVTLGYGDIEFLEDIVKGLVRYLVPLDCGGLLFGYDIASRSVDFFEGISRTDQHILEFCNAVFVGHGILVDLDAGERCSVEAELHALGQSVLGGLFDREVAAAELVAEIDGRHLTADYGDAACFLRHIFVIFGFCYGVHAGLEVVYLNHAAVCGFNGLVDTVALNAEGNAVHLAVLTDLDNFCTAGDQLVDSLNGNRGVRGVLVECDCPFGFSVSTVVLREHGFLDGISAERDRIGSLGIAGGIGRADLVCFTRLLICGNEYGSGKCLAVFISLFNLHKTVFDKEFIRQMIISVRRGCLISVGGVCHTFGGVDFGASLVTYMDNEVLAVIHACKNSRMDMAA